MRNPLNKRLFRELKSDFGKYAVIFIMMILLISEGSGFLVAANSMLFAYKNAFVKYKTEDGNFRISKKLSKNEIELIEGNEKVPVNIYENFYYEIPAEDEKTYRVFKLRDEINGVSVIKGELPENSDEIAVDRMFADNNKLKIGDKLKIDNKEFKISALVALSDYSTMFQNNNDIMFDATNFSVALVHPDVFDDFHDEYLRYCYSWKYCAIPEEKINMHGFSYDGKEGEIPIITPKGRTISKKYEIELSEDLMKEIYDVVHMEEYTPQYMNQAIYFTGEDFGSDAIMIRLFVYIVVMIIAFVFGFMINNTIHKESESIGTLRASGYKKSEIISHYMMVPIFVTVTSALVGNILGYTVFKDINANLYYGSYSLPKFETLWNPEAFVETTIIPVALMMLITWNTLRKKMRLSPLDFIRHNLSKNKNKKALKLSYKIPFFTRFRLRVIFQNSRNYILLLFGVFFANFILVFGLVFPSAIQEYSDEVDDNMFCKYQYILEVPLEVLGSDSKVESMISYMKFQSGVETENENAEKFSSYSLLSTTPKIKEEQIMIYGINGDSKYIDLKLDKDDFVVSSSFADKHKLKIGDKVKLKEEYEDKNYEFVISDIYNYTGSLCVFMNQDYMNEIFVFGDDYFSGYFSDEALDDIDEKYVSSIIDYQGLTKVSRQLSVSMGGFMSVIQYISMFIFIILIYLLSKIIIERNAGNISMAKILGYSNQEVSSLYLHATTIVTIISIIVSIFASSILVKYAFEFALRSEMNGWFYINVTNKIKIKMFIMGIVSYVIVAGIEYIKIKKVSLEQALKNNE
ncbi:MAG: FtsX-like permease family protein [Lachnospiraceae bacterium]|nr:FtsX-like permease family protein [Lachnospiraceae bacterium]